MSSNGTKVNMVTGMGDANANQAVFSGLGPAAA